MLKMCERVSVLNRMKSCKLKTEHTKWFPASTLQSACERIELFKLQDSVGFEQSSLAQREMIRDPAFAKLYAKLLQMGVSNATLGTWISMAEEQGDAISNYSAEQLLDLNEMDLPNDSAKYEYLKFFSHLLMDQDKEEKKRTLEHIKAFYANRAGGMADLSEKQRSFLLYPHITRYLIFNIETKQDVFQRLEENPALQEFLKKMAKENVEFFLDKDDLKHLAWLTQEHLPPLMQIWEHMNQDEMGQWMNRWLENGAIQADLDWLTRKSGSLTAEEKENLLNTRLGYLNSIYSGKLKIPFEEVAERQLSVLVYAIANKQQRFLGLVSEHFDIFSNLDYNSILFEGEFYERCILNSLTLKDIENSAGIWNQKSQLHLLKEGTYTFAELKTLCYVKPVYIQLYNKLKIERVDERLVVIRQLIKKNLLSNMMAEEDIDVLAARLSEAPLSVWREKQFAHIKGLSIFDSVRVLLAYEEIARFLPDMHTWEEAVFAARNGSRLQEYETWEDAKNNIVNADNDWKWIAEKMGFTKDFIAQNQPHIFRFVLNEGSEMTRMYYEYTEKKEAMRRIIQAEIMGQFRILKYYKDDLEREIDYSIGEQQKACWENNLSANHGDFHIEEADDYYMTMRLGNTPYKTCLSYIDGAHRDCLLAGFDSNKKILLARKNGEIVGRAIVRLTKGSFHGPKAATEPRGSLEFVDLMANEDPNKSSGMRGEQLTLFLERPYFSQLTDDETMEVKKMFTALITKKAGKLGAVGALAMDYRDCYEQDQYIRSGYYLYISKSKSGSQYLDSLGGSAAVSSEGSYQRNLFLIAEDAFERESVGSKKS